jgi:predicted metal-dependent phosphoesterase TrpH
MRVDAPIPKLGAISEENCRCMLKVELHSHTSDDPLDRIPHTTTELIDAAVTRGYHALAITLHERQLDISSHTAYAAERGLVLIPGIEQTIEGRHVLLLNFRRGAEQVRTFADLERLTKREPGLVVAPHPFFPLRSCLGNDLDRWSHLFQAVEVNAMFTTAIDFNRRAARWAAQHGTPLVGNGDVHRLEQLGRTYSLVDAEPNAEAICDAIAAGRVHVIAEPLSWITAARFMAKLFSEDLRLPWAARSEASRLARPEQEQAR